jgi:SLEI family protein
MNVEELLKEAMDSYTEGKAYDALIYLETVLEMEEGNYQALKMISKIYVDTGFYKEAIKYSEIAYKKYSDNPEVIFNMGYLSQAIGKYKKALSYYEKYSETESNYHVMLNMGLCYMELKYYRKALEMLEKAIKKEPSNTEGYMDKAECLIRMNQFDRAMQIYEERLADKENNVEEYYIYMRMGDLKNAAGNIDEAIKYYNIAINFSKAEDFVFENFYEMLIKAEKYEEIELLLINFANSGHPREKVLNMEGRYASAIKDFERAKKVCDKLLMLEPDNPLHYFNSAYIAEMRNKFDEALEFIKKAENYISDKEVLKEARKRIKKAKEKYLKNNGK